MSDEKVNDKVDDTVVTDEKVVDDQTDDKLKKTVSVEAYEKAMADMHKYKKALREIENNKKTQELQTLKEKQEWQKIAELKEKEANDAIEERKKLTNAVITDKKMSSVREAAMKAGILDSALDDIELLNWSEVQVETTSTGRINVQGAEDAVKRLKTLKPHWFGKSAGKINSKIPDVNQDSDVVSIEKLNKLRKEALNTGDYSVYEPAFRKYQAQLSGKV